MIHFFQDLHVAAQVSIVLCLPVLAVIALNLLAITLASVAFLCSAVVALTIVASEWWKGRKQ